MVHQRRANAMMTTELENTENREEFDALIGPDRYAIKLSAFEGPLDLLLFLVRRHEVNIYDIPIYQVTQQYLDIMHQMQTQNLEIAGEFFVMAATLMQIKSSVLLPRDEMPTSEEDEEEASDPRWQLVEQLLEYQKFKDASDQLQAQIARSKDYLPRQGAQAFETEKKRPLAPTDRIDIWNTFNRVLRRLSEQMQGSGEIEDEQVSVSDCMETILERVQSEKTFTFSSLLDARRPLAHALATFLALLEITRLKKIVIEQESNFTDIRIIACETVGNPETGAVAGEDDRWE